MVTQKQSIFLKLDHYTYPPDNYALKISHSIIDKLYTYCKIFERKKRMKCNFSFFIALYFSYDPDVNYIESQYLLKFYSVDTIQKLNHPS